MANGYNVAFRYTSEAGGYAGVITWSTYASKEEFDTCFKTYEHQEVVEEGVSDERCIELTESTPDRCMLMAAVEEACDPNTGAVSVPLLRSKFETILFTISLRKRKRAVA